MVLLNFFYFSRLLHNLALAFFFSLLLIFPLLQERNYRPTFNNICGAKNEGLIRSQFKLHFHLIVLINFWREFFRLSS